MPSDVRQSIAAFVRKNEPAWKILQEGAAFEQARYSIDFKQGPDMAFYHPAKLKVAVELGELRTVLFAGNKRPKEAVDSFLVSLAVAQSLRDEPAVISQLQRNSFFAHQKDSLEFAFNFVAVAQADLERLSVALAKVEGEDSEGTPFIRAFVSSRVLGLSYFDWSPEKLKKEIEEMQSYKVEGWTNLPPDQMTTNVPAQRAFFAETFAGAFAICKKPFPERLKLVEYMDSRAAEAKNKQFYFAQAMLLGWRNFVGRQAAGLANVRVMQTAVALEQFRRANRQYPDSLAELAPKFLSEVPADPFNGEPLVYVKTSGYELECRGATGSPISFKVETPPKL